MTDRTLLLCRVCHDAGRISLIPQDCVTRHVDSRVEMICTEGHVVHILAITGPVLDICPKASD